MKEGWEYKKLGEVCEIYQPKTIASSLLKEEGKYPVFGANGMIGRYDSYNHKDPEVLLCCRGATCGAINVSFPFSWINGNAMVVKPINDSYLKTFLRYLLLTLDYSHIITGAAQPQITRKSIGPVIVPVPHLSEQQSIVDYLDSAFAKIDAMKANAEKALNEAKALFQASLKEMLEPKEGWEEKKIKECCIELFAGGDVPKPDMSKNKTKDFIVPIYTNGVENEGLYGYTNNARVNEPAVTISARGTIGATFRRFKPFYPAIRLITAVPNKDILCIDYLYYALKTLTIGNSGTSIPQLTIPNIKKVVIPVPPLSEQQSIVETLDSLKSKVDRLQANYDKISQECDALKQAILRQVFE